PGRRTASPGCSATSSPAGSPTSSTSTAPTASWTPRAPARSGPSTSPRARSELRPGKRDVVGTGGADTFNDIFMFMCFSKTPALSPTGDAKPFDAAGDGTILGEGLGIAVLKRLADAERDGDRVYAVVKGVGTSSDGKGNAVYAPSPAGQVE